MSNLHKNWHKGWQIEDSQLVHISDLKLEEIIDDGFTDIETDDSTTAEFQEYVLALGGAKVVPTKIKSKQGGKREGSGRPRKDAPKKTQTVNKSTPCNPWTLTEKDLVKIKKLCNIKNARQIERDLTAAELFAEKTYKLYALAAMAAVIPENIQKKINTHSKAVRDTIFLQRAYDYAVSTLSLTKITTLAEVYLKSIPDGNDIKIHDTERGLQAYGVRDFVVWLKNKSVDRYPAVAKNWPVPL